MNDSKFLETATFAGGCFWCTEAVFLSLTGVQSVTSGYIGGTVENPTYEAVCKGTTGHAEAVQIVFDPNKVHFVDLLVVFFATHDPTTLNRQGADVGTQYRSEVFYENDDQKKITLDYINFLKENETFANPIITAVNKVSKFYEAEKYHSNYYNNNKEQSYCQYVITPKMDKLKKHFADKMIG